jgi:membrane protein implicated in regulation of membrane protease activity
MEILTSLCLLASILTTALIILLAKHIEYRQKNSDLQDENSHLIERNQRLDEMLEETRDLVRVQDKIIKDL